MDGNTHKKVLLVEDDNDIRNMYRTLLTAHSYEITEALDGEDGWMKLSDPNSHFDCVLLDIMMPKLDGIGFLTRKKDNPTTQNVPVVMMTNVGSNEIMKKCYELGAKYFILKAETDPQKIPHILEDAITKVPVPAPM